MRIPPIIFITLSAALGAQTAPQTPAVACASLAGIEIDNVRITAAVAVAASGGAVAHCRVSGVIDNEIRFTELLPDRWNGRFFAGGAGGFAGSVENQAQASLDAGYATAGTDTGHQGDGMEASWALGNRARQINYGHAAMHRTTETAKAIIAAYYGAPPRYSYFYGCSNGGRQALMAAQRYPADFDGIVACAPAFDMTRIVTAFVRNMPFASAITPDNVKLLDAKVMESCDAADDVRDGVVGAPESCPFEADDLPLCPDEQPSASCVTTAQRAAIAAIYTATTVAGNVVYPGQPLGSESGWLGWIVSPEPSRPSMTATLGTEFMKYFVFGRADWDPGTFDLAAWQKDIEPLAAFLNAENPDLSAFKARGGKLILAHGWADPAINARRTIEYYERVRARDAGADDYVRLFLMPGVSHCFGGPGPDAVDWFKPIADWVEQGRAPDAVIARKITDAGAVSHARPLCRYPQRAVYNGKGNTTHAASYACR